MKCSQCGFQAPPQAAFCPQCGARLEMSAAAAPAPVPAPTPIRTHPAYPRPASPFADLLQILADGLVIAGFFLPWIGIEGTSPLSLMLTGKIVWWMWLIPLLLAFGSLVDLFVTSIRALTGRPAPSWRRWNYFTNGISLVIVCVGWWLLIVYLPVFPTGQGYVYLAYLLLAGTFVGVGAGLVLIFVAAILQLLAGILAYTFPTSR